MPAKWKGRCPFCGSEKVLIFSACDVDWANDDEGTLNEDWQCESCYATWSCHSKAVVTDREIVVEPGMGAIE